MKKMVRMSFTVPPEFQADLNYLSARIGVSKSALLAEMLQGPLADLRGLVESVPPNPTQGDLVRARGQSLNLVNQRVESYRRLEGDLFDERDL